MAFPVSDQHLVNNQPGSAAAEVPLEHHFSVLNWKTQRNIRKNILFIFKDGGVWPRN